MVLFRADLSRTPKRVTTRHDGLVRTAMGERVKKLPQFVPHFRSRATKLHGRRALRLLPLDDSICELAATAHNGSFRVNKAEQKEIKARASPTLLASTCLKGAAKMERWMQCLAGFA